MDNSSLSGNRKNTFICGDRVSLRQILESPTDIIMFSIDREYRYTSFSLAHKHTMKKIWGKDIALDDCILDFISDENDRLKAKHNFDSALSGGYLLLREEYGDLNISRKIWENRYCPIFCDDGSIEGVTVFVTDATAIADNEEMLRQALVAKELYQERELLINSIGEGLYGVDNEGVCTFVNPAALNILGYTVKEFVGKNTHSLIHHHHYDGREYAFEECIIHRVMNTEAREDSRTWLFRKNGEMFPVRIIASPVVKDGELKGTVIAFSDISTQIEMEEQLKHRNDELKTLASHDHLTEIYNRRYFEERGSGLFISSKLNGNYLSLIMFDIDFFKKVNDKYGHSVGDLVLIMVTETVKTQLRKSDIFARIGGEEFVILLPDIPLAKAAEIAERIRQKVSEAGLEQNGDIIHCTISIGVAEADNGQDDIYALLKSADDRQYEAKRTGRNKVIYTD